MAGLTTPVLVTLFLRLWSHDVLCAASISFFDESNTEYVDSVSLRDVTPASARSRRSAEKMPDHIHLDFSTGSHEVSLRLRRSEHIHAEKIPVFVIGDDQRLVKAELPDASNAAVYRDIHHGAAIVVKRPHGVEAEFQLHGTLHIGNKEHTISPSSPVAAGGAVNPAMQHVLRIIQNDQTYGLDYIEPEAEKSPDFKMNYKKYLRRGKRQTKLVDLVEDQKVEKRQSGRHNIDINIVCDYACYKRFYDRHGQNETTALEEARLYFSYLAQSVDVRFRTITDVLITVTPVSVVTSKTPGGSEYSERNRVENTTSGVNGNSLLRDFRHWMSKGDLPDAATTLLQTGYNMMSNGKEARKGQLGLGYRGGACGPNGVVVVEEKFHGITGMIAAHELGHNVNSKHDGASASSDSECTGDGARYVMSTYIGVPKGSSKPWTFSPCSAEQIIDFITRLQASCFPDDYTQTVPDDAGQVYDADDQCAIAFGQGSYFCRGRQTAPVGFEGMCTSMYCSMSPAVDNTCTSVIPLEYTSCGDKMWCIRGQCVNDNRAPSKIKGTCAQGDDPSYGCSRASCGTYLERNVFCCQTCLQSLPTFTAPRLTPRPTPVTTRQTTRWPSPTVRLTQPTFQPSRRPSTEPRLTHPTLPPTKPQTQVPTTLAPTTTTQAPTTVTTRAPITKMFLPYICRFSIHHCLLCLRTNYAYSFCRF